MPNKLITPQEFRTDAEKIIEENALALPEEKREEFRKLAIQVLWGWVGVLAVCAIYCIWEAC